MEISLENLNVDLGALKRVKVNPNPKTTFY